MECEKAKELRRKMQDAKSEQQRRMFRDLLDAHRRSCPICK